jgi:hypothetical protein
MGSKQDSQWREKWPTKPAIGWAVHGVDGHPLWWSARDLQRESIDAWEERHAMKWEDRPKGYTVDRVVIAATKLYRVYKIEEVDHGS